MRLRHLGLATAIVAALLAAPCAQAAQDPDWEGWFFSLDAALPTPGNTNTPVQATTQAPAPFFTPGPIDTSVKYTDFDEDLAARFGFGYSFGRKGTVKVSYWNYDDTSSISGSVSSYFPGGGANWWTIGPVASLGIGVYEAQGFHFDHKIEAETIDLEFTRTQAVSKPLRVTYGVGFRYASFEETIDGRYVVDPLGSNFRFPASRHIDSEGYGLTGSLGVDYDLTEILSLATSIRVGFLNADNDAEQELTDQDFYYLGGTIRESTSFSDEVATTIDFNVALVLHTGPHLDVDVGWMFTSWTDLPQGNLSRSSQGFFPPPTIGGEDRNRINWSGAQVRLTVHL